MTTRSEMYSEAERHAYWLAQRCKARSEWNAEACQWCGMAPTLIRDWSGKRILAGCGS